MVQYMCVPPPGSPPPSLFDVVAWCQLALVYIFVLVHFFPQQLLWQLHHCGKLGLLRKQHTQISYWLLLLLFYFIISFKKKKEKEENKLKSRLLK